MAFNPNKYKDKLLFLPLGGSNEIGMNLNLYYTEGKWLMIDMGIGFADDYLPGIDILTPDVDAILEYKEDILGLVLSHAHEDHIGAVPYLWNEFNCPIYATPFTSALLKHKFMDESIKAPEITEIKGGYTLELGPFHLEMIPLTHSIPEMQAIAIKTEQGTVIHTGDWKFDADPLIGPASDHKTLKRYGDDGVLAIVCDSTNVLVEGEAGSEAGVKEQLTKEIKACENRVIVTAFASNIARLDTILQAAHEAGRKVVLSGRSLGRVTRAAKEAGYLHDYPDFLDDTAAQDIPKNELLVICTGCQGEPRAALTKMAQDAHPNIRLTPGDTVIFTSRVIPGNEMRIGWLHNKLVEMEVEVVVDKGSNIHVSGHPACAELKEMYGLVRPHIAVPVHGERRHIHEHAKLAKSLGVPVALEAKNGAVLQLDKENAKIVEYVDSGYLVMDGSSLIDIDSPIIRQRRRLRDEGVVMVSLVVDKQYTLQAAPAMTAPGSLDNETDKECIENILSDIAEVLETPPAKASELKITQLIRSVIRRHYKMEIGKKPMIEVIFHFV